MPPIIIKAIGAVEVYDISKPSRPALISSALFDDTDVNGNYVYVSSGRGVVNNLHVVGKLQFNGDQSVNHIVYRADMLFVAGGLGGRKILTVNIANSAADNDDASSN
ncbi:MAG: hypothetical protein AABY83_04055 [Pseudomonadota bacterium]